MITGAMKQFPFSLSRLREEQITPARAATHFGMIRKEKNSILVRGVEDEQPLFLCISSGKIPGILPGFYCPLASLCYIQEKVTRVSYEKIKNACALPRSDPAFLQPPFIV